MQRYTLSQLFIMLILLGLMVLAWYGAITSAIHGDWMKGCFFVLVGIYGKMSALKQED